METIPEGQDLQSGDNNSQEEKSDLTGNWEDKEQNSLRKKKRKLSGDDAEQGDDEDMCAPRSDLVERSQPMEAPEEMDNTAQNQPADDPRTTKFTWTIENFSRLKTKKIYSEVYEHGDYKWRVLIFPKGNGSEFLCMYLDVADSASLPCGWTRCAHFSLTVVNQVHSKYSVRKETQHQFNAGENDWGFTSFMPLDELYDATKGYLVNDTCVIEAEVTVSRNMDRWLYDSKKETGFVGLKNKGATCYMNSLIQMLFHIPLFRKAVYYIPSNVSDLPSASFPLALQSLFYKLQYNDKSVAATEWTKSFGWDRHDVRQLSRVLRGELEVLEEKMEGTSAEGAIQQLFEGHHVNYLDCISMDSKSRRKESFYGLQLDVKGCHDVYASFDKYVEVERTYGDNKYQAEQYVLQDAREGVLFTDFPPVLQLHLKRFEYDFMRDIVVKINDRYEFPLQLDLDSDNGKYLSPDADKEVRNLYTLYSVLVHSGSVHGGHYYAFVRPTLSNQWYKFDDERVTKEDMSEALEELYGGEEHLMRADPGINNTAFKFTKHANAYMLVYIRESDKDRIMCNVDEKDIAENLRERMKREQVVKEQKKKEKAEARLYTIVKVACDEDFARQIGSLVLFDLVDHDKVRSFHVPKQMTLNVFKEEVAKEFGIPVQYQRFWLWAKRQNHTFRPTRLLTHLDEARTVGYLSYVQNAELNLFLEIEFGPDKCPSPLPSKGKDDILLFFKFYDPENETLRYAGRLFVKTTDQPTDILAKLNEMAGHAPDEEIELYEEIRFEPYVTCEHIDKKFEFGSSQLELGDGDIVCLQKSLSAEARQRFRCPDVPSFFEYQHNLKISYLLHLESNVPLWELHGLRTLAVVFRCARDNEMAIHYFRLSNESTISNLLDELRVKVKLSHPDAELRLLEECNHKIYKIFLSDEKIESIKDYYWRLRAEEIPEEEKNLGPHDCLIHVYHFMNEENQNQMEIRNFGEPFLLVIHEDEKLADIKNRVQEKLHVPDEEFSKWKFAFISQGQVEYLEDSDVMFSRFQRSDNYVAWERYLGLQHVDNST